MASLVHRNAGQFTPWLAENSTFKLSGGAYGLLRNVPQDGKQDAEEIK